MRVLITSIGSATSVNLIRFFHKLCDFVVGVDINPIGYTAGSMMVDIFYKIDLATNENYLQEVIDIIKKDNIDLFIPINDIEVFTVSNKIHEIPCKCVIPDKDTISLLRDKFVCSSKMREIGIPIPEVLNNGRGKKRILRDRIGVGSKGIEILEKKDKTPMFNEDEKFLQLFVEGQEYTVDILADLHGKPVYIVPRKRIEVKSGVATKVKIEKDDKLIQYCEVILQQIRLPGFSNIQFIKDENGEYWFVEINYRFSGCGAATLATCKNYLKEFKKIAFGVNEVVEFNQDVRWNSVVTRYYEEKVYEEGIY